MKKIQKAHVALIIKYTGISFITWGLSHWFFSWDRQIITSLTWVVLFIIWTLMEQKPEERDYKRTIIFSSILAVSIGALTWWLQHFPDSPDRSAWLVPAWFLASIFAYLSLEKEVFYKKTHLIYTFIGLLFFVWLSALLYSLVQAWYLWAGEHWHSWDHHWPGESTHVELPLNEWNESDSVVTESDDEIHFKWDGHTNHSH